MLHIDLTIKNINRGGWQRADAIPVSLLFPVFTVFTVICARVSGGACNIYIQITCRLWHINFFLKCSTITFLLYNYLI